MKRSTLIIALLLVGLIGVGVLFFLHGTLQSTPVEGGIKERTKTSLSGTHLATVSSLAQRKLMSEGERVKWLEQNGEVPKDADPTDWRLAKQTSWWGQPLDPKEFWKNRTLWSDESAKSAARRHGRFYPPVPNNDDPIASQHPNEDIVKSAGIEGPDLAYHYTDREHAYWNAFAKNKPKPPEELERKQLDVAHDIYSARASSSTLSPATRANLDQSLKREAFELNYPKEAFTEDAMHWADISAQRRAYQNLIDSGSSPDSFLVRSLLKDLPKDARDPSQPLSDEEMRAANAWKVAYLQRLQQEKLDPSYINAYLKAWNLPSGALTNGAKGP